MFFRSRRRILPLVFLLAFLFMITPYQTVLGAGSSDLLKQGMSGSKVLQLQKDLKSLGFFNSSLTGYFGEATESAVISFQKKHKISPTGNAGTITLNRINTLLKRTNTSSQQSKSGIKIVIDAGHGGRDPGTSKGSVVEKEVNLDISKMLESYLENKNYDALMTRSRDISLYKLSSLRGPIEKRELDARVNIIGKSKARLFVSVHVNSLPKNPAMKGSIVFYNSKSSKSKALALSIQKELNNLKVNGKQRPRNSIRTANFYILKNSSIPGVLVETAFITNKEERKLLTQKSFREKIAKAIMNGIENSGLAK
ncbi:MAG: N-acetylmuramoyl-L-alanine amidase [Clostridia bacterium]|nr:N-acetylmuramoyl-L-alanine amidase [Clostridia bacterium]